MTKAVLLQKEKKRTSHPLNVQLQPISSGSAAVQPQPHQKCWLAGRLTGGVELYENGGLKLINDFLTSGWSLCSASSFVSKHDEWRNSTAAAAVTYIIEKEATQFAYSCGLARDVLADVFRRNRRMNIAKRGISLGTDGPSRARPSGRKRSIHFRTICAQ